VAGGDRSGPTHRRARSLAQMLDHPVHGATLDLMWAIFGPEVYLKLTGDAAMGRDDYERCMVDAIARIADGDR
jgi:hypothetical protein